jgi:hypothetical protein
MRWYPDGRVNGSGEITCVYRAGKPNVIVYSIAYKPERCSSRFGFSPHTQRSPRLPRLRTLNPGLVSFAQLCNDILLYLLCVAARVDRIGRNTQPVDGYVALGGTVMVARNEHYLVFTPMEVVSDDEMMPITFQRAARFRNKESGVSLKLNEKKRMPSTMIRGYISLRNLE